MKLTINELYAELGSSFDISHKVILFTRELINVQIMHSYKLDESKEPDISLLITTKRDCQKVEVKGPDFDKRNNCRTWGLWLPYQEIVEHLNPLEKFVDALFDALGMVLSLYKVSTHDINRVRDMVKKEVLNNLAYISTNERIPMPDLSHIKF